VGDTPFATEAARLLSAGRDVTVPPPSGQSRENAIAALAAAMGDRRRANRQRRVVALAAAAAVVVALGVLGAQRLSGPVQGGATVVATQVGQGARLFRAGSAASLAEGGMVAAGDRVAAGGGVSMHLSTGTNLKVEAASELQFVDTGPALRLALLRGAVRADVAKLRRGERFVVTTADAEIEVKGTSFRLAASAADTVCDEPTTTRLEVFEGVVAVRRGAAVTLVGAGSVWPSGCHRRPEVIPLPAPAALARKVAEVAVPRARRPVEMAPAVLPAPPPDPASTLAEQNDLFARAMAARRRGDRQGALVSFFELERRFPTSPLGEASMVERMRLVSSHDREAARAIAREYLARYPGGYAGAEARALVAEPPER
jgi:ferric-dicitrate binding protein FerR (iron transport regulator)